MLGCKESAFTEAVSPCRMHAPAHGSRRRIDGLYREQPKRGRAGDPHR